MCPKNSKKVRKSPILLGFFNHRYIKAALVLFKVNRLFWLMRTSCQDRDTTDGNSNSEQANARERHRAICETTPFIDALPECWLVR